MRKSFTTTIEEDIQNKFKTTCKDKGIKMNEVLEAFMQEFNQGNYEVETIYKLKEVK